MRRLHISDFTLSMFCISFAIEFTIFEANFIKSFLATLPIFVDLFPALVKTMTGGLVLASLISFWNHAREVNLLSLFKTSIVYTLLLFTWACLVLPLETAVTIFAVFLLINAFLTKFNGHRLSVAMLERSVNSPQ